MRTSPARSLEQLLTRRPERLEVILVLARALVDEGVKLEVDLVESRREMNRQRTVEHLRVDALEKAAGQPKIHEICWPGIQPALRHPKVLRHRVASPHQIIR